MLFYLDESGDDGYTFNQPYRHGGSSRYLTIFAAEVPAQLASNIPIPINFMYSKYKWKGEKKGSTLSQNQRIEFCGMAIDLLKKIPSIKLHAMTVSKVNVFSSISSDPNKLYNYMVNLLLLDRFSPHANVTLAHDQRSISVNTGDGLEGYLQAKLPKTVLKTKPMESHTSRSVQFVDCLANICWSSYEDGKKEYDLIRPYVNNRQLYFK